LPYGPSTYSEQTALHSLASPLPLLQALAQDASFRSALDDPAELLALARSHVPTIISPEAVPLWDLGLAARETAPRVEAFLKLADQLADDRLRACESWVEWLGNRACGVGGLETLLSADGSGQARCVFRTLAGKHALLVTVL
jgi:hypothetical protein